MTDQPRIVVIGAGLAAAKAIETLRDEGFDGSIALIGDEPEAPYERPALSKGYLQGASASEDLFVHPDSWYAEHRVDTTSVSYTHLRAHETDSYLVCRLLL